MKFQVPSSKFKALTARRVPPAQGPALFRAASSSGVALVITLIMLAVITFMAVTFLVLSNRERGSVTTATDQLVSHFAADTALERAKVELMAPILVFTNDQAFNLMVSTNYINPAGFVSGVGSYTNVNFTASGNDSLINLTNLFYNPRPPVFIVTNKLTGASDFRFYLDLNRNGMFEPNGYWPDINSSGRYTGTTNFVVGDPEWIGVLEHPQWPHSANNKFVSRYAYLVVPSSKTLDLNYLHNYAKNFNPTLPVTSVYSGDGFMRNEGVGTWEINLAALLTDLNTNIWYAPNASQRQAYSYLTNLRANSGWAFVDALSILRYRYAANYKSLAPGWPGFVRDGINEYSAGPLMTSTRLPADLDVTAPWPGSDNTNHFFSAQELFDPAKVAIGVSDTNFVDRLTSAGKKGSSYDRYTFYRMLAQLGVESSAPFENKMNINYRNVTNGMVVAGMETNMIPWSPLEFFTNAADRMLRVQGFTGLSSSYIPVYPVNYYTPAVHRIFQAAANVFEATTNTLYPCIYRPMFKLVNATNYVIAGFELVNGPDDRQTTPVTAYQALPLDLNNPADRQRVNSSTPTALNFYGVPWVIGAKKGFPNLNAVAVQSVSQITRKLQVSRPQGSAAAKPAWSQYHTRQMVILDVSNSVAVEVWNSYSNSYPRPVSVRAEGVTQGTLTNTLGFKTGFTFRLGSPLQLGNGLTNFLANGWAGTGLSPAGSAARPAKAGSFVVPLLTNCVVLSNTFSVGSQVFQPSGSSVTDWNYCPQDAFPNPGWVLDVTNNIRCIVFDGGVSGGRVVDYVQLAGLNTYRDLSAEMATPNNALGMTGLWSTNLVSYLLGAGRLIPQGVVDQLEVSLGNQPSSDDLWAQNSNPLQPTRSDQIRAFQNFIYGSYVTNLGPVQVPFTPTAKYEQLINWQANDPLVHYLASDLNYSLSGNQIQKVVPPNGPTNMPALTSGFFRLTDRYAPWGGAPGKDPDNLSFNTAIKDPQIRRSDDWDFPTNKFPNVGWLGRVHRGTPWQTVYLKAEDIAKAATFKNWQDWCGSGNATIARNMAPVTDRHLFDVFTTASAPNATRGQLSVNQTNLAAWSAVLSGVIVLTNDSSSSTLYPMVVNPAGIYDNAASNLPPVAQIVRGIVTTLGNTNGTVGPVFANQAFHNLGDILATPQLTDLSPFINTSSLGTPGAGGLSDEVIERLPQQILSLLSLSHSPRFVVYAYGQTLHPAERSIVTSGPFAGLCTNYQVTAEAALRAVVRMEGSPDVRYTQASPDPFGNYYPPRLVLEQFNPLPPD